MENGEEYINALDQAINDEEIRNIAITAPYGAGKSSVIKTYVKKHPSLKYTFISMATFNSSEGKSQDDGEKEVCGDLRTICHETAGEAGAGAGVRPKAGSGLIYRRG